jgi:hypothetical protein
MPKLKRPSLKQKLFAKKYVETLGNGRQSALEVYDVKNKVNASSIAKRNLEKPYVQEEIRKILLRKGIDLDWSTDNLKSAIESNLKEGKPSQAVGADLLKFAFKLHDVIPGSKNLSLSYKKEVIENKDYSEIKDELVKLSEMTKKLLEDTP